MKHLLSASLAAVALSAAMGSASAADVGVSIGISQPGVYGRIDIGRYPQPVLVAPRPVWVAQPRAVVVQPEPVYLWVPPGHRRHWHRHCAQYGACGQPVYFVQDRWYHQHVAPPPPPPRYEPRHGHGHGHGHGHRD